MSNALSIAAVTAVLKDLIENGLVQDAIATSVGDVVVTALPPDRITQGTDERAQINLFLYQVTQNRNADWISEEYRSKRRQLGDVRQHPPLALDLHYLITAYGAKDFQAELLFGYVMQLLHDTPVFSRELIETALKNAAKVNTSSVLSQALTSVSIADVAENIGQIKISPEFFNMEDTSKLWSSLQTPYRPSAPYQVSMVLIDSRNAPKLVDTVDTNKLPFLTPVIEQVTPPSSAGKAL
ncbi:MAG: Pvc16 family protein, partial [Nostoc sp.]